MAGMKTIWDGLDWSVLTDLLLSVVPALLCITFHELCHGLVALRLGDTTAKDAGRLTLNPLRHIDVMGLLMMVVFKVGWAKPVPVNMMRFRNPKAGMAVTALAGPVSNFLLACVFLILFGGLYRPLGRLGSAGIYILQMMRLTIFISLGLMLFNLLPVPPLDGSKVLFALLPDRAYFQLMRYERYGMILLVLLVATGLLGSPLSSAINWLYRHLLVIAAWMDSLVGQVFR